MFFVAKEKIGTTLGAQKEYTAAERRGIRFYSSGNAWHYLWPIDMVEQSVRERFAPQQTQPQPAAQDEDALIEGGGGDYNPHNVQREPDHILWSQEVGPGHVIGEPVISAFSGSSHDWIAEARQKYDAEMQRRAAEQ